MLRKISFACVVGTTSAAAVLPSLDAETNSGESMLAEHETEACWIGGDEELTGLVLTQEKELVGVAASSGAESSCTVPVQDESRWVRVFRALEERGDLKEAVDAANEFRLSTLLSRNSFPEPSARLGEDDGELELSWDREHGYLVLSFDHTGGLFWFGRDDRTGVRERGEDTEGALGFLGHLLS